MSYPYSPDHPNVTNESTPELESVLQESVPIKGEVDICNPVETYILPSRLGVARSYPISDTVTMPVLGQDRRRRRVILLVTVLDSSATRWAYIGSQEDVRTGNAAVWPSGIPLILQHTGQIYARCAVVATAATLTVIAENWAD